MTKQVAATANAVPAEVRLNDLLVGFQRAVEPLVPG